MTQMLSITWIELKSDDGGILERNPQEIKIPEGSTVSNALDAIGLGGTKEDLLKSRSVAVYGQYALADTRLYDGDRIEVLDTLRFDPKESRRRRASHKKQEQTSGKAAPRRSKKRNPMG